MWSATICGWTFVLLTLFDETYARVGGGKGATAEGNSNNSPFIGPCLESNVTSKKILHEFQTEIVHNEFIVKFSGFYKEEARKNYIAAALAHFEDDTFEVTIGFLVRLTRNYSCRFRAF